jgi:hypothetical protein
LQSAEPDQSITAPDIKQCFVFPYVRVHKNLIPNRTEMIQRGFQLSGASSKSPFQQPLAPYVSLAHRISQERSSHTLKRREYCTFERKLGWSKCAGK